MRLAKLTKDLQTKLQDADPSDKIRVIANIAQSADGPISAPPMPSQTREAFRKKMFQAQEGVRAANSAVLAQVEALGLTPGGGVSSGAFYVDASPSEISRLTEIEGITSVTLDKRLDLIRPK